MEVYKISMKEHMNELLKEFCKQYTKNNADISKLLIAIIAALIIVFTGYAYTIVKYNCYLPVTHIITAVVLSFLSTLAVEFGYCRRRDQNTAYKMMCGFDEKESMKYFKDGSGKCYLCFLPDFYEATFVFFQLLQLIIGIVSVIIFVTNNHKCNCCCCHWEIWAMATTTVITTVYDFMMKAVYYMKYINLPKTN